MIFFTYPPFKLNAFDTTGPRRVIFVLRYNSGEDSSGDETEDPTENDSPPKKKKVDDLLQESRQAIRNLEEASQKFK